ncbi:MAG: hypothetical protein GXO74_11565, partial [Calditrichaeota bacterium]|nr:hypothetical protein [Calditrichota bacterium]
MDVLSDVKLNVVFSETVEQSSAENIANYQIQSGAQVKNARLKANFKEVELTTTPHVEQSYRLTVQHVRDRANSPNEIAAGSHFDYDYIDTIAPALLSVEVVSDSGLVVIFSEPVEKSSGENAGNYSISGGIGVVSAQLDASDVKRVFLKTTPHAEQTYTLTVLRVKDRAKAPNEIAGQNQLSYEFVDRFPPQLTGITIASDDLLDIYFNEPVQKSSAENAANYSISPQVTVLNADLDASEKIVHLQTEKHSEGDYMLHVSGVRDRAQAPNTIADNSSLSYKYIDQIRPVILGATCENDTTVKIQFSEAIERASGLLKTNYSISPTVQIQSVRFGENSQIVILTTDAHQEGNYQLTVNHVRDRAQHPNEILANTIFQYEYVDRFAPGIIGLTVLADNLIEVEFNEPVSAVSAETAGNYLISPNIVVEQAVLQGDNQTVSLHTTKHEEGSYSLTVVGVTDRATRPNSITQPIVKNYEYVDHTPPAFLSAQALTDNQVDVFFSEPMDKNSCENIANYQISDGIVVYSATLDADQTTVHLSTSGHVPGNYTITVANVKDNSSQKNRIADNAQASYQYIDQIPPALVNVDAPLENLVEVTFSEPVEKNSAENTAHYQVNNGIQIESAVLDESLATVRLQTTVHVPGDYVLTVRQIKDRAVNPNQIPAPLIFAYSYVDRTPPVITNAQALSDTAVEIIFSEPVDAVTAQNSGNYLISNNVQVFSAVLQGDQKTVLLRTSSHMPGQYVIEVKNVTDRAATPNVIAEGSQFTYQYLDQIPPELTQVISLDETHVDVYFSEPVQQSSAENVSHYIINNNIQVSSAHMDDSGEIVHLQTSEHVPGNYRLTVSQILDRATPPNVIAENSHLDYQYVDRTPPMPLSAEAPDETHVDVTFSEPLDKNSAENAANYAINGNVSVVSVSLDANEKIVHLQTTVQTPGQYTINFTNIADKADSPNAVTAGAHISYEYVDRIQPTIVSVVCDAETQVDVIFSEPVQKSAAENIGNYSINHNISISSARLDADLRTVHLTTSTHSENTYTLTVNHIF